jgi:hypothetical protein
LTFTRPWMSRPSRVTPEEVTVTFPEPSELHPAPLVTWVGTTRNVTPEGTPALAQVPATGSAGAVVPLRTFRTGAANARRRSGSVATASVEAVRDETASTCSGVATDGEGAVEETGFVVGGVVARWADSRGTAGWGT